MQKRGNHMKRYYTGIILLAIAVLTIAGCTGRKQQETKESLYKDDFQEDNEGYITVGFCQVQSPTGELRIHNPSKMCLPRTMDIICCMKTRRINRKISSKQFEASFCRKWIILCLTLWWRPDGIRS